MNAVDTLVSILIVSSASVVRDTEEGLADALFEYDHSPDFVIEFLERLSHHTQEIGKDLSEEVGKYIRETVTETQAVDLLIILQAELGEWLLEFLNRFNRRAIPYVNFIDGKSRDLLGEMIQNEEKW